MGGLIDIPLATIVVMLLLYELLSRRKRDYS